MKADQILRYFGVSGVSGAMCIALFLFAANAYSGQGVYYQWIDETGKLNISDHQPAIGVQYETIKKKISRPSSGSQSSGVGLQRQVNRAAADEQREAGRRKVNEANADIREGNCDNARQEYNVISNSARVREVDVDGNHRYLTDEEKQQRGERALANTEQYCDSGG